MVTVRYWEPADLPQLAEMSAVTAWNITPPDDKPHTSYEIVARNAQRNLIQALQSPGGTCLVAADQGVPVGYLLLAVQHNDRTGEPYGYFADVYIKPEYRGGTLARDLHYMGEDHFRRLGLRKATNWTHAHNPIGQKAQQKVGIGLWGLMMVKHLRK